MLQEVFVTLAAGAQHVGAPEEHVARPVRRIIRIETGRLEIARTRAVRDHGRRIGAGFVDMAAPLEWVDFGLGGGGGPGPEWERTRLTSRPSRATSLPSPA